MPQQTSTSLSQEQQQLFEKLENSQDHFFVTGKAGTGKSHLLQYFKAHTQKNVVVVAPTGVAAINVGGQTIHSLFRIPPTTIEQHSLKLEPRVGALLRKIDTLIIDEISMVRADLMDAIDFLLRQARKSPESFGGIQVIMFGDLYQLPPVVNDRGGESHYNSSQIYFFQADVWRQASLQIVELTHIFRQKDSHFIELLNAIRTGSTDQSVLIQLNERVSQNDVPEGSLILATTNRTVFQINAQRLAQLPDTLKTYNADVMGPFETSAYPTEETLQLKRGAQVMMLKNDREKRWANGTLGIIEYLDKNEIGVNIDGTTHAVTPDTWSKIRYTVNPAKNKIEEEVISSFTQFPLRLAWAVTIHKSQGQTYDRVIIDLGHRAFAHGQVYVALSRCTNLQNLYLNRPIHPHDIIVDQAVINFMNNAIILNSTSPVVTT